MRSLFSGIFWGPSDPDRSMVRAILALSQVGGRPLMCVAVCLGLFGCASSSRSSDVAPARRSAEILEFGFAGIDGALVSSGAQRGRATVILFMTTFDVASQAQARRVEDLIHLHAPRLNAVGVFLEAPKYVELARGFRESLGLSYPLAIADPRQLADHPQLRHVQSVPAWIFLDQDGRIVSSAAGSLTPDQLDAHATEAQTP